MRHLLPCAFLLASFSAFADDATGNPIGKALQLLADLEKAVSDDAHRQSETYAKYAAWCEKTTAELDREASTAQKSIDRDLADMSEVEASLQNSATTLEKLASQVAVNDAKLSEMTKVREDEEKAYQADEKSLAEAIKLLDKAATAIADGMKSEDASFLQAASPEDSGSVLQALLGLAAVIDAAGLQTRTAVQLSALLQSQDTSQREEDADVEGAVEMQSPKAYSAKSSELVDLIKKMSDEAEENLESVRQLEQKAKNDFTQLRQSLQRQIDKDKVDMLAEKKSQQTNLAEKAKLTGNIDSTKKEMEVTKTTLGDSQVACLQAAADQESSEAGRKDELAALNEAVKALKSSTSLTNQDNGGSVFLQLSAENQEEVSEESEAEGTSSGAKAMAADVLSEADAQNFDASSSTDSDMKDKAPQSTVVLNVIKKMADQQHSPILAQLAATVSSAIRAAGGKEDPLANVRQIVKDHIKRMQAQMASDATEDEYCKTETSRSEARLKELNDIVKTGQIFIDKAVSDVTLLKQETQTLQEEISKLAQEEVDLLKNKEEFEEATKQAKDDLERGLSGIKSAIDTLKEYYGSQTSMIQMSSESIDVVQPQETSKEVALMEASMGMNSASPAETEDGLQADEADSSFQPTGLAAIQEDQRANAAPKSPEPYRPRLDAGSGVITILEACETDFAEQLAKLDTQATDRSAQHKDMLFKNKLMHASKTKSIEHKTKEFKDLEAEARVGKNDLEAAAKELKPLKEYYAQVKERCSWKGRRDEIIKRREQDMAALKEALSILEGQASLAQLAS